MENSIYIGLSRQVVLQAQMDMVANNVANISTPGYRAQNLLFKEFVADPKGQGPSYSMVYDVGQYTSAQPGVMMTTGAPLDVALQGPGFMTVTTPQGPRYTRAGSFILDAAGTMRTQTGEIVGAGITIPQGSREITIDESGTVSTENGPVGQIEIVEFANTDALVREGNGLYRADGAAQPGCIGLAQVFHDGAGFAHRQIPDLECRDARRGRDAGQIAVPHLLRADVVLDNLERSEPRLEPDFLDQPEHPEGPAILHVVQAEWAHVATSCSLSSSSRTSAAPAST